MAEQRTLAPRREIRLPDELVDQARRAVGRDLPLSQLVRLGLATLAGVDVEPYTLRPGRPRKHRPDVESEPIAS